VGVIRSFSELSETEIPLCSGEVEKLNNHSEMQQRIEVLGAGEIF
jgi:hypothetical protein